jgi:general secretion pathway protein I
MLRWRHSNDAGFTLIEVLVALAIVAIALLAALRVAGQGANNAGALRSRLFAGWIAENRLAEHRARGDWLALGNLSGMQGQGGIEFGWREQVISTPNPAFRRIDVFVFAPSEKSHALAHLVGFVVRPPGNLQ